MTQQNLRRNTLVKGRVIKRPAKKFGNIRPFIYRERLYGANYAKTSALSQNPSSQHEQTISAAQSAASPASTSHFWIVGALALLLIGGVALFSD
ncbi:MAG: hypothetical protein ACKOB7_00425, partial [Methylocystis sp.]